MICVTRRHSSAADSFGGTRTDTTNPNQSSRLLGGRSTANKQYRCVTAPLCEYLSLIFNTSLNFCLTKPLTMSNIPMYYKSALTLCLLFLVQLLPAQADRALKLIEQGKYTEAEPLLRASLDDQREQVLGYYGLAYLYSEPESPRFQLDSAYRNIESSRLAYKALDAKDKGKVSKDLSSSEIGRRRTLILKAALEQAAATNTLTAYQYFLDHYPGSGSRYEGKAMTARNELAYKAAREADTETAYTDLLNQYGDDLKARNRSWYDATQKLLFERYIEKRGWSAYPAFAEQHPDNVYVRDSLLDDFKSVWEGPTRGFASYIYTNPESPFLYFALDSLGARLSLQSDTLLSPQFILQQAEHPSWPGVYGRWYEDQKTAFRGISDLDKFKSQHPDFPFPERWESDAEVFLDRSFEKLEVGKALGAFRIFIDKYPNYSRIDSVWMRYYKTFKMERPGAENLDRFLKVHPDFPFPEVVTADKEVYLAAAEKEQWANLQAGEGTADLFRFTKQNKNSPYWQKAVDLLAERLISEGQSNTINGFLNDHPDHPKRGTLLEKLWQLFPDKHKHEAISQFQEDYPDFPKPELLEAAKANAPLDEKDILSYSADKRNGFINYIRFHAPQPQAFDALWRMLGPDLEQQDWDAAYKTLQDFQKEFEEGTDEYQFWLNAFAPENRTQPQKINPNINTDEFEEYSAVITTDDQTIYFCRNIMTGQSIADEDIYVSVRDEDGNWSAAHLIDELKTDENEAPEAISADGNLLFVFRNGKILTSEKTKDGWSEPTMISKNINRANWQADTRLTADGKAIIFTSMTGFGAGSNRDIYISHLQEDGSWGPATPLSDSINTDKDDRAAFLHPDMKTLYFSSAGHRGLGDLDIFVSKRLDDSWTNWSKPVNLGPGINTADNDWSFKVTTDGKFGYYNVLYDGQGGDIFMISTPEIALPGAVATVSGQLSTISGDPLGAQIQWVNLETGELVQTTTSDPGDGTFFATLPSLGQYSYTIKKEGYFPISGNLDFSESLYHHQLDKEMTVTSLEEMKEKDLAITLNNLFFETGKYDIKPTSFPELNSLADWVTENNLSIAIHGHTDHVGDDDANQILSENRAREVRKYLIARGLSEEQIVSEGFGESRPVADNETVEGRAMNRRVEIRIIH